MKLEECKTYPFLTFSPSEEYFFQAIDNAQFLNYFVNGGVFMKKKKKDKDLRKLKEPFFMLYTSTNNVYDFYDSKNVKYLMQRNDGDTKFMVFKANCLDLVDTGNVQNTEFIFSDGEFEYDYYFDDDYEEKSPKLPTSNHLIIGGISFAMILLVVIAVVCVMKRKNMYCFQEGKNDKVDGELKVHQNDLYGNLSNLEEWQERYDTNIVDTNTYYEDYDNAYENGQNEDDKEETNKKDVTIHEKNEE